MIYCYNYNYNYVILTSISGNYIWNYGLQLWWNATHLRFSDNCLPQVQAETAQLRAQLKVEEALCKKLQRISNYSNKL
jgi:mannose-1-phosphate guanylyltransferase